MAIDGLDAGRCRRRNRVAAYKGEVAIPVRFAATEPASVEATLVKARGTIPETPAAAVRGINAHMGLEGDDALKEADVHLLFPEVANSNYISDRSMFLHSTTLRNVQAYAADPGFAFMNSHRTGTVSTDSELPFGWTFAGRYEVWELPEGSRFGRTLLGAYMRAGVRPNGDSGPSTDDFYAGIKAGTLRDVSIGLREGEFICDVCGNGLYDVDEETGRYLCPHVPGTARRMTDEERQAQLDRGVPDGVASFSLVDAIPGEFSAVYDGAVPGAGFRKATWLISRAAAGEEELSRSDLRRLGERYGPFLGDRGRDRLVALGGLAGANRRGFIMGLRDVFGGGRKRLKLTDARGREVGRADLEDDDDDGYDTDHGARRTTAGSGAGQGGGTAPEPPPAAPDPAVAELRGVVSELAVGMKALVRAHQEERQAQDRERLARLRREADAFAANLIRPADGRDPRKFGQKILPSQRQALADIYFNAAVDDEDSPLPEGEGRLAAVKKFADGLKTRDLLGEATIPDSSGRSVTNDLGDVPGAEDGGDLEQARQQALAHARKVNARGGSSGGNGLAADLN